jgi:hypothetical protein
MREASDVAAEALHDATTTWAETGLTDAFNALTTSVWKTNLARHREGLGDDATTLGTLCARNLANRVQERVASLRAASAHVRSIPGDAAAETTLTGAGKDADEFHRDPWAIDGLTVDRPRGSLRLSLGGRHFYVMKAPMSAGRRPDWDSMVKWDGESDTRREIAETNFRVLGDFYNPGLGQGELWEHTTDRPASAIREFLLVWAGEPHRPQTSGWLTVPGIGEAPFIARGRLWWDPIDDDTDPRDGQAAPTGASFADGLPRTPDLTLEPLPGGGVQP